MMIRAYDKLYVEKAQLALATMLDYAVSDLGYELTDFYNLFLSSSISTRFASGDCSVIVGRSGVELVYEIFYELKVTDVNKLPEPKYNPDRTSFYWTGWALCFYQWYTALSFQEINKVIPIDMIHDLYFPYHEMDIMQFVDKMTELYKEKKEVSNLQRLRVAVGLTQKQLSDKTGVPLRTIQNYEQKERSINKAQAQYLVAISKVLTCNVEDLLELE